jgi:hypothetical protein
MEAGTVPEKVTISHRGDRFEIGRGKRFYGIWVSGAPESDPIDRWPQTRDGWEQAWMRFVSMETPGTITETRQQRAGFRLRLPLSWVKFRKGGSQGVRGPFWGMAAAGLLGLGVLLGVIGLFPDYFGSQSLASQAYLFVPHLIYLLTWAVSAALIVGGLRARSRWGGIRLGALLGTGLSAVTFGLLFADLGQVIGGGASLGAGLVLSLIGWLACAAGSVLALAMAPRAANSAGLGGPSRPRATDAGPVILLLLAAVGAVATFVPSWDSYTLSQASTGATETVTAGNAFANPGAVIAGNVAVIVAVIGVAVLAALWRPVRQGAVLLAGMVLPLAAQAISALIQASQPASPGLFGISQSQASAAGLTVSSGLTPIFWVYCVFVISLLISCAWMLTAPHYPAMPDGARAPEPGPASPGQSASGEAGDSDSGGEDHEESTYA